MQFDSFIDNEDVHQRRWMARQDVRIKDAENVQLYTDSEVRAGIDLEQMVAKTFLRSRVFRQHREKFITVKVERPQKADRDSYEACLLEQYCDKQGYTRHRTASAILFRIAKK